MLFSWTLFGCPSKGRKLFFSRTIGPLTTVLSSHSRLILHGTWQTYVTKSPAAVDDPKEALFAYTSGRWLGDDQLQRDARYVSFDYPALCATALKHSTGATRIVSYSKMEGSFNKMLDLTTDTGEHVIARLPTRIAGPTRLTTNSEVATITYLRSKTSIPLPEIIAWNDDPSSPVASEYILMRPVRGVPLLERWPTMSPFQHVKCVQHIAQQIKRLAGLEFPAYGSLYFDDAPLQEEQKIAFEPGFCIGPHCGRSYWNTGAGEAQLFPAPPAIRPRTNLEGFISNLLASAESRIPQAEIGDRGGGRPSFRGSPKDQNKVVRDIRLMMERVLPMSTMQVLGKPLLQHPDLHKRNIFVDEADPSVVTAIIDWQSSAIEPAFIFADDTPDFAKPLGENDEAMLRTSEDQTREVALHPSQEHAEAVRESKNRQLCAATLDASIQRDIPFLAKVRSMDGPLFRLFRHANTTWHDGVAGLRNDLFSISRNWQQIGLPGSSTYMPTEAETASHARDWEDFEAAGELHASLVRLLQCGSDGWVSTEDWEAKSTAYRRIYDEWLASAADESIPEDERMTEQRARALWPFEPPPKR